MGLCSATHRLLVELDTLDVEGVCSPLLSLLQTVSHQNVVEQDVVRHGPQLEAHRTLTNTTTG